MDERLTKLEELAAHLVRVSEDLSDVVARQEKEIDRLRKAVELLSQREAEREIDAGGTVPLADQKPPHW